MRREFARAGYFRTVTLFAVLAGTNIVASADDGHPTPPAPVGPTTAAITQLNYDEVGGAINGFLIGTNTLLTFQKRVCSGITTLGTVGDSVTYSGLADTLPSGFQIVRVSSFTNGKITYPTPMASAKPSAYPLTAGTITQLNYDPEDGSIDGFVFTPASGPVVLVALEHVSSTLTPLLISGTALSVTGTTFTVPLSCPAAGTLAEVSASTLTIGKTTYQIGNGTYRH